MNMTPESVTAALRRRGDLVSRRAAQIIDEHAAQREALEAQLEVLEKALVVSASPTQLRRVAKALSQNGQSA